MPEYQFVNVWHNWLTKLTGIDTDYFGWCSKTLIIPVGLPDQQVNMTVPSSPQPLLTQMIRSKQGTSCCSLSLRRLSHSNPGWISNVIFSNVKQPAATACKLSYSDIWFCLELLLTFTLLFLRPFNNNSWLVNVYWVWVWLENREWYMLEWRE